MDQNQTSHQVETCCRYSLPHEQNQPPASLLSIPLLIELFAQRKFHICLFYLPDQEIIPPTHDQVILLGTLFYHCVLSIQNDQTVCEF